MITEFLLNLAFTIVDAAWNLVPTWTIPVTPMQPLIYELSKYNAIAPFTEMMQMASILLVFFGVMHGTKIIIKIVDWFFDIIP